MAAHSGSLVAEFLADRIASGFSDEAVRAMFEEFWPGAKLYQEELDAFKVKNAGLIVSAGARLTKEFEESMLIRKTLRLVDKLERDIENARNAGELNAMSRLLKNLKDFSELLLARTREIKKVAKESDASLDHVAVLEELERSGLISILNRKLLRDALSSKKEEAPITFVAPSEEGAEVEKENETN